MKVATGVANGCNYGRRYSQCYKIKLRSYAMLPAPSSGVAYARSLHAAASGVRPTLVDGSGGVAYDRKLFITSSTADLYY
jgi:hypothetical protein